MENEISWSNFSEEGKKGKKIMFGKFVATAADY